MKNLPSKITCLKKVCVFIGETPQFVQSSTFDQWEVFSSSTIKCDSVRERVNKCPLLHIVIHSHHTVSNNNTKKNISYENYLTEQFDICHQKMYSYLKSKIDVIFERKFFKLQRYCSATLRLNPKKPCFWGVKENNFHPIPIFSTQFFSWVI